MFLCSMMGKSARKGSVPFFFDFFFFVSPFPVSKRQRGPYLNSSNWKKDEIKTKPAEKMDARGQMF